MKTYLEIKQTETNEVVESIDVTGKSERQIDGLWSGMSINLNHEEYYIVLTNVANINEAFANPAYNTKNKGTQGSPFGW